MMRPAALMAAACLALALGGCGAEPASAPTAPPAAAAPRTAIAEASASAPLASVPATVIQQPGARVAVTAGFAGVVQQVHVVEGQAVKAGDTLATIFSRDALALASERARAEARLSLARANAARIGQLADEGVVAAARADEARAALREAEVQLAEAERVLGRARASADGIMRLVAPIDGRVSHVAVETGGPLDGMAAPFVIDGGKDYALELQLPERLAGRVRPGMPVLLPGGERGVLISVGSGLDPATRSITAIARLEGPAGFLSGSALSVTILSATGVEAVVVPTAAVTRIDGEDALFVKKGDGFQPLKVVPGGSAGGKTTILDGVEAGAVVAISGLPELRAAAGH